MLASNFTTIMDEKKMILHNAKLYPISTRRTQANMLLKRSHSSQSHRKGHTERSISANIENYLYKGGQRPTI